jgi:hypothetical protein
MDPGKSTAGNIQIEHGRIVTDSK